MAGNAAHGPGVFVVDFALHQALAKIQIVFSGRNCRPELTRRTEQGSVHAQRRENVLLRVFVECDSGEPLNDFAEHNKS